MATITAKAKAITINDQVIAITKQAEKIRASIDTGTSPKTLEELKTLETSLQRISEALVPFEQRFSHLQALAGIGQVVNSTLDIDEVLQAVMDTIVRLTEAERGFLMLRDERGEMVIRIARNWEQESINQSESSISRTIVQKVIDAGEAILTTNALEDKRFSGTESVIAFNLRSILCVPLMVKTELTGVIYTDNRIRTGIFSEADRDLLIAFANQAAVAIENARLFSSLKRTLAEVTELKNLMDDVFASIVSGVLTADVQDQITLCNRAAASILGQASAEIVGRKIDEVVPTFASNIIPHLESVRKSDKPVIGLELSQSRAEGGNIDWRLNLSPLKDAGQKTQGVAIVLDDLTERKKLEAQRGLLQRMVSPAVLDQIDPNSLQVGGKKVFITVLFADVRGFTSYSEKHSPEELVAVLNQYLAAAADAVLAQEGTVDKFLGDAVMAWYNAPILQPDHTLRAVKSALAIREAIARLHSELPKEAHLDFGVGIHYGEAVLGWIGTEKRLEFTSLGDSVNTTKRIQENAAKNQILISKEAYERVKDDVQANPFAPLTVKGKAQPLEVFEVMGLK
ncbi:MAG TPA: adenylate/guanylate cyclase domain-containing protein [Anaerolineales bacterium]|nr:GAF domain-containing protein [Anaerolineales bacterium]HMR99198.1 adenylate/guanylate cyclase domain-containing protein [Anaerolineales bacterium]HNQ95009.1 adenylate/guanylate cyclase domain-containing protein [Anaerolineales bacterium]HNS61048.1 adenylate/guanylate cyclase domain-containing protein [Anaerolineales bacterium]